MSNRLEYLGGRLPLVSPGTMNEKVEKVYTRLMNTMIPWAKGVPFKAVTEGGEVIGPFNPILYSPEIAPPFLEFQDSEKKYTTLTERERQVIIMTVGFVWRSSYELYAHTACSQKAGLSESTIQALRDGEPAKELNEKETIAQMYTKQLVAEHRVDDDLYKQAKQAFKNQGLMDITFLIGSYLCVCSTLNSFAVPVPSE